MALMQSHLLWENPKANREMFTKKIDGIPEDADVVVLPEMFTTGFTMKPEQIDVSEAEKTLQWMKDCASKKVRHYVGALFFVKKTIISTDYFLCCQMAVTFNMIKSTPLPLQERIRSTKRVAKNSI